MTRTPFPLVGAQLRTHHPHRPSWLKLACITAVASHLCVASAQAQTSPLRQVFDAAWAMQPEAVALATRQAAASAEQQAANAWTAGPAAVELSNQTDRLNRNVGMQELELGVSVPLWLPGERGRSQTLAAAQQRALDSRTAAARLKLAGTVREAWWAWQRATAELDAAQAQLRTARTTATDASKRVKAGELARADQHQADSAVAAAEGLVAQASAAWTSALQQLAALSGLNTSRLTDAQQAIGDADSEPPPADTSEPEHATLLARQDSATASEAAALLAATQQGASPELKLATTRSRGAAGEPTQQTWTLGVRWPFGGGAAQSARQANARADALEQQALVALERQRLSAERAAAQARTDAARAQLAAAQRRAQLAVETRGFFEKSFRLGETDLPTRLRIEADAADAERQAARARIDLAAAISAWRQALGLLP
ncbi:MAG: transporter [Burkholderiales bacterium PBB6]|nr:MAG: transporter [Burkholderiales bacterium PBB6]